MVSVTAEQQRLRELNAKELCEVLQRIVGTEGAERQAAAEQLGLTLEQFEQVLSGEERLSRTYLKRYRWREMFGRLFPQTWAQNKDAFETCVIVLPKTGYGPTPHFTRTTRDGSLVLAPKVAEPRDKGSFEWLLWHILGGENLPLTQASIHLRISSTALRDLLEGRALPYQEDLIRKEWEETLRKNYPLFADNAEGFQKRFERLPHDPKGPIIPEPEDPDGFQHALWVTLGGVRLHPKRAATNLNMTRRRLQLIFEGKFYREDYDASQIDALLQGRYEASYNANKEALLKGADRLPVKNPPVVTEKKQLGFSVVDDPNSFGFLLAAIVDAENTSLFRTAKKLRISKQMLIDIFEGKDVLYKDDVFAKDWKTTLPKFFGKALQQHGEKFWEAVLELPDKPMEPKIREPALGTFRHTMWVILGGNHMLLGEVRDRLKLQDHKGPRSAREFFDESKPFYVEDVFKKGWPRTLRDFYGPAFLKNEKDFYGRLKQLPHKPGKIPPPRDKNSLLYTVWVILGAENIKPVSAAKHLHLQPDALKAIFAEKRALYREDVLKKDWESVLRTHYSAGFTSNAVDYKERAAKLPVKYPKKRLEPDNKASFEHILWTVLGGDKIDPDFAAKKLHIYPRILRGYLDGSIQLFKETVIEKDWEAALEKHFGEAFDAERDEFRIRLEKLCLKGRKPGIAQPKDKGSVQYLLWTLLGAEKLIPVKAATSLRMNEEKLRDLFSLPLHKEDFADGRIASALRERCEVGEDTVRDFEVRISRLPSIPAEQNVPTEQAFRVTADLYAQNVPNDQPLRITTDETSFAYVVSLIVSPDKDSLPQIASTLKVDTDVLRGFFEGQDVISREDIVAKDWQNALWATYPGTFSLYKNAYWNRANLLPRDPQFPAVREPSDKNSFGHAVWGILGGEDMSLKKAVYDLNFDQNAYKGVLEGIISGSVVPSQQFLKHKLFRALLMQRYPEGWEAHKDEYLVQLKRLPESSSEEIAKQGPTENELSGIIWKITGKASQLELYETARRADLPYSDLCRAVDGDERLPLKRLQAIGEGLSICYPEAWKQNAEAFERYVRKQKQVFQKLEGDDWESAAHDACTKQPAEGAGTISEPTRSSLGLKPGLGADKNSGPVG